MPLIVEVAWSFGKILRGTRPDEHSVLLRHGQFLEVVDEVDNDEAALYGFRLNPVSLGGRGSAWFVVRHPAGYVEQNENAVFLLFDRLKIFEHFVEDLTLLFRGAIRERSVSNRHHSVRKPCERGEGSELS